MINSPPSPELGLLGQSCNTPVIFEIYRNPVTEEPIGDCLSKVLEMKREVIRQANRDQVRLDLNRVPRLWILTPTASDTLLESYRAWADPEWPIGIFPLARALLMKPS